MITTEFSILPKYLGNFFLIIGISSCIWTIFLVVFDKANNKQGVRYSCLSLGLMMIGIITLIMDTQAS